MPFISLSNVDYQFSAREFNWRSYITTRTLPTARQVELIIKHEFAKTILDESYETFVVHVAALNILKLAIYLSQALLLAAL